MRSAVIVAASISPADADEETEPAEHSQEHEGHERGRSSHLGDPLHVLGASAMLSAILVAIKDVGVHGELVRRDLRDDLAGSRLPNTDTLAFLVERSGRHRRNLRIAAFHSASAVLRPMARKAMQLL